MFAECTMSSPAERCCGVKLKHDGLSKCSHNICNYFVLFVPMYYKIRIKKVFLQKRGGREGHNKMINLVRFVEIKLSYRTKNK